jgi:hypothetical protein
MTGFVIVMLLTIVFIGFTMQNHCFAAYYTNTYWLLDYSDGETNYQLNISVTSNLYEYYNNKNHKIELNDFGKFVTPYALKPIADTLLSIYNDDEDFANGVLMFVHQIPYEASTPQKYPVETIVENEGDCDLFSFIVASIMMAGGLDVVLLYYEEKNHMNVGVKLSQEPNNARSTISYFIFNDERYYMAETTGGDWENGWRVGERPDLLEDASANIITLEDAEQISPGQVSSSYGASSSISLVLSSNILVEKTPVVISGSLTPSLSNRNVTIYVRSTDSEWRILKTILSDSDGHYSFSWDSNSGGIHYVSTSWSGDENHMGANSDIQKLIILPVSCILVAVIAIVLAIVAIAIFAVSRRNYSGELSDSDNN